MNGYLLKGSLYLGYIYKLSRSEGLRGNMEYPIKVLFWKLPFLLKKTIRIVPLPKMRYISNYTSTFIHFFFI